MPIVRIELLAGRDQAHKNDLIKRVTAAVVGSLGVKAAQVRVLLYEIPPDNWSIGGVTVAENKAQEVREELSNG